MRACHGRSFSLVAVMWWVVAMGCGWGVTGLEAGSIYRVSMDGKDEATGGSWGEAVRTVPRALELAVAGDDVWVAKGAYTNRVIMKAGVALYGGFAGTETALGERDWLNNETILDGGGTNLVVLVEGGGEETVVDGFTIQRGSGCGVRLVDTGAVISHNRIRYNVSSSGLAYGAGVSVKNMGSRAVARILENVILDNYAFDGGGVACIDASPEIVGNLIAWNTAVQNGGGISCWREASPLIANNRIHGNTASWGTGAVPIGGGGIFATADDLDGRPHPTAKSSPLIRNNVVAANGAANGGGMALVDANGGVPVVLNNTVVANSGSGVLWGSSALVPIAPVLVNNVVAFNPWGFEQLAGTPTNAVIENNCVFGNRVHAFGVDYRGLPDRTGQAGNISADPRLALVRYGNLHLQPGSPCRDAGQDRGLLMGATDVDGEARMQGAAVDLGADESSGASWSEEPRVVRVKPGGDDGADGASWATAKGTLAGAVDAVRPTGGEVWVAAGTHAGHFWLPAFVHMFGGFSGDESERNARQPAVHRAVLDGGGKPNVVMSGQGGFGVSTLDGFTVTGGGLYTGGTNLNKYGLGGKGGGVLIAVSSPVITNNVITRNSLAYDNTTNQFASYGAGISCERSFAIIGGNTIEENEILNDFDGSGAGVYCLYSMPLIVGNRIARNQAVYGPGIYAWASSPLIVGNTIESNSMYVRMPLFRGATEGAISVHLAEDLLVEGNRVTKNTAATGAGLYFAAFRAGEVRNNLFVGNHAYDPTAFGGMGGAMYVMVTSSATNPIRVVNNTLVANVATNMFQEQGGGIAFTLVSPATNLVIANNVIVSNSSGVLQTPTSPRPSPGLSHNNLKNAGGDYLGLAAGAADFSREVAFVNAGAGDYRLAAGAADIDAADAAWAPLTDLAGVARPLDGDGNGVALPDVGAFESVHATADTDGDGMTDWKEVYGAGTNPADPGSVLAVQLEVSGLGGGQLAWFGVAGTVYVVERATRLGADADWQVVQEGVAGEGVEMSVGVEMEVAGFYRVRTE